MTVLLAGCVLVALSMVVADAFAAQSTKDVTASPKLKQESLQKVGAQPIENDSEYVIGHGDVLGVSVYGEGDMAAGDDAAAGDKKGGNGVTVRLDGRISLKHVGDVQAAGLTPTQLADMLKTLFATVYDDPVVTVVLQKSESQRYTVMGKVAKPGVYPINYPINLVQAIAECGGFDQWANSEVTVVRKDSKDLTKDFQGNTLKFDYDDFLAGKKLERNVILKSGDIVIVH
ncbi:MAG: polysaccharide biosynthesis/export family protein [Desulfobulbaceae bacterium]|jgi:polysaccharide export outer membrane protein|nr:polysaccharide biosynthesis/export family protein [Desulfobulbaceae bacterium]